MNHVFIASRCIFCNVNDLDEDMYGPFECTDREPLVYTTSTGDPHVVSVFENISIDEI